MPVKFYTDSHISKAVVSQARHLGVDIVHCAEVDKENDADLEHLKYATEQRRTIITGDADFAVLHKDYQERGETHTGIIYVAPMRRNNIGLVVKFVVELHELIEAGAGDVENDVYNKIVYL